MNAPSPTVELSFPVIASASAGAQPTVPADHGYLLFSAISRVVPQVHRDAQIGIHALPGEPAGDRQITLIRGAALGIRAPADLIPALLPLAGKVLVLDGARLQIGVPAISQMRPAAQLVSRLVIIKGMTAAETLLEAARAQCRKKGIVADLAIPRRQSTRPVEGKSTGSPDPFLRRTLRIGSRTIVGYAMVAAGLAAEDSVRLQEIGIGGRRHFGCGVFVPFAGESGR